MAKRAKTCDDGTVRKGHVIPTGLRQASKTSVMMEPVGHVFPEVSQASNQKVCDCGTGIALLASLSGIWLQDNQAESTSDGGTGKPRYLGRV